MPYYSDFTRYGHLRYSSKPPYAKVLYDALITALGDNYDVSSGSKMEAWVYATAMLLGRVRHSLEMVGKQMDPRHTVPMLPTKEAEYGLIPGRLSSIHERQAALAAKMLLPQGARFTAVTAVLAATLGSDFLGYRVTKPNEIVNFPVNPAKPYTFAAIGYTISTGASYTDLPPNPVVRKAGAGVVRAGGGAGSKPSAPAGTQFFASTSRAVGAGPGNWIDPGHIAKVVKLTSPLATIGLPVAATYDIVSSSEPLEVGDTLVVSANNIGLAELVTVLTTPTANSFTATYAKSHDTGDICTTGYFPYWVSTQSHVLVVVKPSAAADPEKKRITHLMMNAIMRDWVTWDIVPSTDGVHTDAVTVGDSVLGRLGYAGLGSVTFP